MSVRVEPCGVVKYERKKRCEKKSHNHHIDYGVGGAVISIVEWVWLNERSVSQWLWNSFFADELFGEF